MDRARGLLRHTGGCHCGKVRFEVLAPAEVVVDECNCSICSKSGYLHLIVPGSRFTLLQGESELVCYQFNSGVAKHYFCRHCGIKSFYVPRSNPDGFSINVRCLDPGTLKNITVEPFDGRDWEANAAALKHRSEDQAGQGESG